jgi:ankyrin repeat protein
VEILIDKGADINAMDEAGHIPLYFAAHEGHTGVVKLLLVSGADANAKEMTYWIAPLQIAVYDGHKNVVEIILAGGADVNAKDKDGGTPLHIAANRGRDDLVKLLLTKCADVDVKEHVGGYTPLHLAVLQG